MADLVPRPPTPPPPTPTTVPQAIADITALLDEISYKLQTLIGYYIHPETTPTQIKAFEPRLLILQERLNALSKLSYIHLSHLIDNSDQFSSQYLISIIDQLLNAALGIQKVFADHYDPSLHKRLPFSTIWKTLEYRMEQVRLIPHRSPSNPRRIIPEEQRPNEIGRFCSGALQMINLRDKGKISIVDRSNLSEADQRKMRDFKGVFLDWECPECNFKVHFHVSSSTTSNIHSTDEIHQHDSIRVQYRSSFLAKSHLYLAPHSKTLGTSTRRESVTVSLSKRATASRALRPEYGCLFCYALGKDLEFGRTTFATQRHLAEHLSVRHRKPALPSPLLHRFSVAINGKMAQERLRWDVNLL
ncbi:hypothetical protein PV10_07442 [Exophiala mesophila]|uniref:C2H2-type domain-containing protein n=1 Tax=Exophiala mesophila TaxID=212818 RepID=A0A0D1XPS0_EXOME|nr:uncharacterized protein PV10_07442 [Exophiala mesophila]KIV90101.1 hypothetical protein PV10_07442 [Exophiala mesophila]